MATASVFFAENTRDSMFYRDGGEIYNKELALLALQAGEYTLVHKRPYLGGGLREFESIWASCQNIDDRWCHPARRSMSVGDVILIDDDSKLEYWITAACGFDHLETLAKENAND